MPVVVRKKNDPVIEEIRESVIAFIPRLRRFAFSLTGDWDQTEEIVQDTCERALAKHEQWQHGTSLESWMCRIAQNVWKDGARARKRRAQVSYDSMPFLAGPDGRREMEGRLTLKAVMTSISMLPDDQRLVIALVCIEGRSYGETAGILDIPVGTVMSRLARARQALHENLKTSPGQKAEGQRG